MRSKTGLSPSPLPSSFPTDHFKAVPLKFCTPGLYALAHGLHSCIKSRNPETIWLQVNNEIYTVEEKNSISIYMLSF